MNEIDDAFNHVYGELLLTKIKESLGIDYEKARKAHDSIHEFLFIASKLVPNVPNYGFHKNSAYLLYHREVFDLAHRSSIEALSTYYNAAFILLRSTIELMIRGAFFECIAHKKYRDNALVLDSDKRSKKIKDWINHLINYAPSIENDFENISASIYDKIADFVLEKNNVPPTSKMLEQIISWGILDGIEKPYDLIYNNIFGRLSFDVHILPDYIDIGRVLVNEKELFKEREVMPNYLLEYCSMLHKIMDIGIVITLNILVENVLNFEEIKKNLQERGNDKEFVSLDLQLSQKRIASLIKPKSN